MNGANQIVEREEPVREGYENAIFRRWDKQAPQSTPKLLLKRIFGSEIEESFFQSMGKMIRFSKELLTDYFSEVTDFSFPCYSSGYIVRELGFHHLLSQKQTEKEHSLTPISFCTLHHDIPIQFS